VSAPLPPRELATYVIGNVEVDDWRREYDTMGRCVRAAIVALLGDEWSFAGRRVLDFGCGSARVLRHFLDEARMAQIMGCDIDPDCVEWINSELCPPLAGAYVTDAVPPLPFANGTFDLAWSIAVFSQLTDSWADWLLELRRVIKPGGLLIASVMGAEFSEAVAGEAWEPDCTGMNVLGYGRPWHAGGPMVLHSEWWIRSHWGRAFEIVSYRPGEMCGQDAILLRRPPATGPAPEVAALKASQPDEPRELAAALHSIEQLHRQFAKVNGSHDAYASAYHKESRRSKALQAENAELRGRLQRLRSAERALTLAARAIRRVRRATNR